MEDNGRTLEELLDELQAVDDTIRITPGGPVDQRELLAYRDELTAAIAERRGEPMPTTRMSNAG